MQLRYYLHRAVTLPPHLLLKKGLAKARRDLGSLYRRQHDRAYATYALDVSRMPGVIHRYLPAVEMNCLRRHAEQVSALAELYLAHRFDLLGSGWVQVAYGMRCRGLEGYYYDMSSPVEPDHGGKWLTGRINTANLRASQRLWVQVNPDYRPIDWHLDVKSGYRWSEHTWYLDVSYGHQLGVDVKVPWELARMQHLPQLGWAYALAAAGGEGFRSPQEYAREFRNQVLDFMATNPPRYGVNWCTAMDVAIRAANWLIAYDLFRAYGAEFDAPFVTSFHRSVYEHGLHIAENLEWSAEVHGNHYLANVVGLLFVAAYLRCTPQTDCWLAFAVQELVREVEHQFTVDGGNFEASTSYHCLSAEMVTYATALVLSLPADKQRALQEFDHRLHGGLPTLKPAPLPLYTVAGSGRLTPFPPWYIERLERMAEFTMHITKSDGHIPQIGDNDSGRFVKLQPVHTRMTVADAKARYANLEDYTELSDETAYWDEDHLNHLHLVAAINGLFQRDDLAAFTDNYWIEHEMVQRWVGGFLLPSYRGDKKIAVTDGTERLSAAKIEPVLETFRTLPDEQKRIWEAHIPGEGLLHDLRLQTYPEFGLYVFRSRRLYLAMRCGPSGEKVLGCHAHNDQLSIELTIDGVDWLTDPGTYLYTPLPNRRNEYRSATAHFGPSIDGTEPGRLDLGLFQLQDCGESQCILVNLDGFYGALKKGDLTIFRILLIQANCLTILDYFTIAASFSYLPRLLSPLAYNSERGPLYSRGYGKREYRTCSPLLK